MLDYILIDETLVRQLRRYEILEEGTFSSTYDHLPVIACVELDENPHIDLNNFSKLPAWHKINEHSIKEYQDKLCAPLDKLIQEAQNNDIDINLFYHNLVNTLINTAKVTIPCNMYNPHTKLYWNADVKQAHTKERNMRRAWMQDGRPRGMQHESYFNYKRAKRDFRNIQKLANEQYIEETYDDINNAAECDIRLFWKLIKRQKPKHSKVYLYTPADTSTFDDPTLNEMNKAYREIERVCKADEDLYLPGGMISCDDVSSVIKQLKRRKACGNDMIQNEHLIYGGPKVSECLSIFLNIVVEKQQVPSDWQKGLVVPLFKGADSIKYEPGQLSTQKIFPNVKVKVDIVDSKHPCESNSLLCRLLAAVLQKNEGLLSMVNAASERSPVKCMPKVWESMNKKLEKQTDNQKTKILKEKN
ncbi:Hypothetical predicted protein [Mytilus galloprovincialis]|uniref:Endonuclease/exonuclease/phosphatase domain-containing protein n=1 Tax=Mytilus galloprovincialis TaxID=29158 RepID=A0A8B6FI00_MYTGA|nr:Hypothetical predicted protein [Mytilus galloprovincialis]